jgi:hypothetical protein
MSDAEVCASAGKALDMADTRANQKVTTIQCNLLENSKSAYKIADPAVQLLIDGNASIL